jgi:hypothetical protein
MDTVPPVTFEPVLPQSSRPSGSWVVALNQLFVQIYKLAGFVVLLFIVLGMAYYLATSAFYFLSRSWVVPEILGPQHTRVAQQSMQLLQQKYELRKLELERRKIQISAGFYGCFAGGAKCSR